MLPTPEPTAVATVVVPGTDAGPASDAGPAGRLARLARDVRPNWFASVMGTGILANASAQLPWQPPCLRAAATVVWALAALLLVGLVVLWCAHVVRHPAMARSYHLDPVMAHFYGAPPMALLTVGAGTLALGSAVIGARVAVAADAVLWATGTALGLAAAVAVPYLQFTRHTVADDAAFGGWLMPIVPPMVSAATGAALVPHVPAGQPRLTMLLACYAMFGLSLVATLVVLPQLWGRLARHKVGAAAMVPTLWIVLGPLGQSTTAVNLLGAQAPVVVADERWSWLLGALGIAYGVPVLGFILLWLGIAGAVTVRTVRAGMPFAPTWWSFTFPVGVTVTGISALAVHTGSVALRGLAVIWWVGLLLAWLVVATRSVRAGVRRPAPVVVRPGGEPRTW